MLELTNRFVKTVEVTAAPADVHAVLADVPDSVNHFPDLESLVPERGGYTWTLARMGKGKLSHQLVYACRYDCDPDVPSVAWTPIDGVGNAHVSGRWIIEPSGSGTRLTLHNDLTLFIRRAPRMIRAVAQPVLTRENSRVMAIYLDNLCTTFRGGDGRLWRL